METDTTEPVRYMLSSKLRHVEMGLASKVSLTEEEAKALLEELDS